MGKLRKEWIEPLTVHARHPLCLGSCADRDASGITRKDFQNHPGLKQTGVIDNDYILLGKGSFDEKFSTAHYNSNSEKKLAHQHSSPDATLTQQRANRRAVGPHTRRTRNFLLDAGTSTFKSSLWWFICGYEQVGFIILSFFRYISDQVILGLNLLLCPYVSS